jgi:hypothetical protein
MTAPPENLEFQDSEGYLEVRALGDYSLSSMKSQLERAVEECRTRKARGLLFDITAVEGYRPSTGERFQIGSYIAELLIAIPRFACLARTEQIDRENFTSRVATNRGKPAPVFNVRAQAVDWILGKK